MCIGLYRYCYFQSFSVMLSAESLWNGLKMLVPSCLAQVSLTTFTRTVSATTLSSTSSAAEL